MYFPSSTSAGTVKCLAYGHLHEKSTGPSGTPSWSLQNTSHTFPPLSQGFLIPRKVGIGMSGDRCGYYLPSKHHIAASCLAVPAVLLLMWSYLNK